MDLLLIWKGLMIGIAVSIPLGPLGMLCVQKTVNKNWASGIFSGIGIASADTIFAMIGGFSLTFVIEFVKSNEIYFKIFGLIVMVFLGIYVYRRNPARDIQKYRRKGKSYLQDFLTTFLITLTNPLSIFVFIAIFTSYSIVLDFSKFTETLLLIAGIFLGGSMWWTFVTGLVNMFRHKFTINMLLWANRVLGIAIIVIAILLYFYLQMLEM